jgi:rSAM/selenodomain-associated transferase 1
MPRVSPESSPQLAIAIMAKAPIAGLAKTRLTPHLGADGAAALQRWLLERTVCTALASGLGPVILWCAPDTGHPVFIALAESGEITLRQQPAGDLGERMAQAVAESAGVAGTLVIGTDCPLLTPADLRAAGEALATHDAVVAPAEDGGYVLIGLRQVIPEVFSGIDWSTDRVMAQTRQRLAGLGCSWFEFSPFWDVDRSTDFERLLPLFPELQNCIQRREFA